MTAEFEMQLLVAWAMHEYPESLVFVAPNQHTVIVLRFPEGEVAFDRREFQMNHRSLDLLRAMMDARLENAMIRCYGQNQHGVSLRYPGNWMPPPAPLSSLIGQHLALKEMARKIEEQPKPLEAAPEDEKQAMLRFFCE